MPDKVPPSTSSGAVRPPVAKSPTPPKTHSSSSSTKIISPPEKKENSFLEFIKKVVLSLGVLFGVPQTDNSHYENYLNELKKRTSHISDRKNNIFERADIIFEQAKTVIDHAEKNISHGKEAHEGLKFGMGVPLSGDLQFLGGDDLEKEILYQNIAAYNWAETQRLVKEGKVKQTQTFVDLDNTSITKAIDPGDTHLFQSASRRFQNNVLLSLTDDLNIAENCNTARTGLVSNQTSLVPEGLLKRQTIGTLPSFFLERIGILSRLQLENSEKAGVIALNGTVIHTPKQETYFSADLIEGVILDRVLNSPNGPKIDGKTIGEHFRELALKKGFAIFEPKQIPRFAIDSMLSTWKYYHPHYMHIVTLKEELVDHELERLRKSGKDVTQEDQKKLWNDFKDAVKKITKNTITSSSYANAWNDFTHELKKQFPSKYNEVDNLKKEFVDKSIKSIEDARDDITPAIFIKAWGDFFESIKYLADGNSQKTAFVKLVDDLKTNLNKIADEQITKDTIWLPKESLIDNERLYSLIEKCENKRLDEFAKLGNVNYVELLEQNPQRFYETATQGVSAASVFHFFNNFGTPDEKAPEEIMEILRKFNKDIDFRKRLSAVSYALDKAYGGAYLCDQTKEIKNKGMAIYTEKGAFDYVLYRVNLHLMNYFSKEELGKVKTAGGVPVFECGDKKLTFSKGFTDNLKNIYEGAKRKANNETEKNTPFETFINYLKTELKDCGGLDLDCDSVIDSALPEDVREFDKETKDERSDYINFIQKYKKHEESPLEEFHDRPDPRAKIKKSEITDENEEIVPKYKVHSGTVYKKDITYFHPNQIHFYPNDYYALNSKRKYDGKDLYSVRRTIADKRKAPLNNLGQYYIEDQPNSEKVRALPPFSSVLNSKLKINAAGDSESDVCMMAKALESGGFADVVFNLVSDNRIFEEIISQRCEYDKEFHGNDGVYQTCKKELGIYGLKKVNGNYLKLVRLIKEEDKSSIQKIDQTKFEIEIVNERVEDDELDENKSIHEEQSDTKYYAIYDKKNPISKADLIKELKEKYLLKIIHNSSPDAYIRRRAEIYGAMTGTDVEFNKKDLERATEIYKKYKEGKPLSKEEEKLLWLYEYLAIRRVDGDHFASDRPHSRIYYEWKLKDGHGEFIVYRNKTGKYLMDRGNGKIEDFKGDSSQLKDDNKIIIKLDANGNYIQVDNKTGEGKIYNNIDRLNDHWVNSSVLFEPSPASGAYKFLSSFMGERTSKAFFKKLPKLFQGLLRYSGLIMGFGGIVRLLSPLTFGYSEGIYKLGYKMSNYVRAVSAVGGALRGALNVNRYWNITAGEVINIIASFMNDGVKHGFLGLGNFVLFLGRGQQAVQRQQRVNNHAEEVLKSDVKSSNFKDIFKKYVDPRPFARRVTNLGMSLVSRVREEVQKDGLWAMLGEISGSLLSAAITPIQMIKDLLKDPRLIFSFDKRQSEKSGGFFRNIPSPGHLMTLVGGISGISALISGTMGRRDSFGDVGESGFNKIGRWAISAACGIPAIGIIANAREVMANIDGLPKKYTGLDGKETTYNPKAAGLLQAIAGAGFGVASIFDLSNKYAASLYDVANGIYFNGAAIEEGPNTFKTAFNELRASNRLYERKSHEMIMDFEKSNAA